MEIAKGVKLDGRVYELKAGKGINIDKNNVISTTDEGGGFDTSKLPNYVNEINIDMSLVSALNGLLTLPIVASSDFYVNWGDGTGTHYEEEVSEISHQYEDVDFNGKLSIYGDWLGIQFSSSDDDNKNVLIGIKYDSNISTINNYSFYRCINLNFIDIQCVISLGQWAFGYCANLKSIELSNSLPELGKYAFFSCSGLKSIELPLSLTAVNTYSLAYTGLTSIKIPNTIINIGERSIMGCSSLTSIELPDSLKTITFAAFDSCVNLNSITIPESVISIGSGAFISCRKLTTVITKATTPPTLSDKTFDSAKYIFVPAQSLKKYKTATNWDFHIEKIYPISKVYSETVTITVDMWSGNKMTTVEAVGVTSDPNNVIEYTLVDSDGNQIEDIYGITAVAQGTMMLTFKADTVPTEDVHIFVKSTLTNYE